MTLEYLAGFVDGEGCIRVVRVERVSRSVEYRIDLAVSNTHYDVLRQIHQQFGGWLSSKAMKGNRKPAWCWVLAGQRAADLLEQLLPFLIVKRQQARWLF